MNVFRSGKADVLRKYFELLKHELGDTPVIRSMESTHFSYSLNGFLYVFYSLAFRGRA